MPELHGRGEDAVWTQDIEMRLHAAANFTAVSCNERMQCNKTSINIPVIDDFLLSTFTSETVSHSCMNQGEYTVFFEQMAVSRGGIQIMTLTAHRKCQMCCSPRYEHFMTSVRMTTSF